MNLNWFRSKPQIVRRLEKRLLDLEAKLEAAERITGVTEAERDAMAEVIARDRMRVAAETAIAARSKAECEGGNARDQASTL